MRDGQGNCSCRTSEYFSAERYSTPSVSVRLRSVVVMFCTVREILVKRLALLDGRWMFRVEGDIVLVGHGDTKLLYVYASNPSSQPPFTQDDA